MLENKAEYKLPSCKFASNLELRFKLKSKKLESKLKMSYNQP